MCIRMAALYLLLASEDNAMTEQTRDILITGGLVARERRDGHCALSRGVIVGIGPDASGALTRPTRR